MFFDRKLVIYLVSPQPWQGLKVSKHHYALELSSLGHTIYFIEPPDAGDRSSGVVVAQADTQRIYSVSYSTWFPYGLKFRSRALFDMCMRRQARLLCRAIGQPPDVVWDFDNAYQFADLGSFGGNALKIFHAVDDLAKGRSGDKGADVVLSVSQRFLDRISPRPSNAHLIPHALNNEHLLYARSILGSQITGGGAGRRLSVGYVGNLEHAGIDWPTIVRMVEENRDVDFEFIGPIRDASKPAKAGGAPVETLASFGNCNFRGALRPPQILEKAKAIDIWLVCYDPEQTVDGATNSHKILEYLATGKAVLSNRLDAYAGSDLVFMPSSNSNAGLPEQLRGLLGRLEEINDPIEQRRRAEYATGFSYANNLRTIDTIIGEMGGRGAVAASF